MRRASPGYWPAVGPSIAVARRDGRVAVQAPEDEEELAREGWADEVRTYSPDSLSRLPDPVDEIETPLRTLLRELGLATARLGCEDACTTVEATYAAHFILQPGIERVLGKAAPSATPASGAATISRLRSRSLPARSRGRVWAVRSRARGVLRRLV
jgi:hypothetical protein